MKCALRHAIPHMISLTILSLYEQCHSSIPKEVRTRTQARQFTALLFRHSIGACNQASPLCLTE